MAEIRSGSIQPLRGTEILQRLGAQYPQDEAERFVRLFIEWRWGRAHEYDSMREWHEITYMLHGAGLVMRGHESTQLFLLSRIATQHYEEARHE